MKILLICALLGTVAHCKPGGYFRQEYQFKKSSSTFKNNELQTKDDDQGFYHKQGDLHGPADVEQHNEQSQYVSPTLGGVGQTITSFDNRDLTDEAESAFANHGIGRGNLHMTGANQQLGLNSGMNTGGHQMGAGGGRSYSSYSSYSSYGSSSNGQISQANLQQIKQNLQQELTECLQEAMSQYRKEVSRNTYSSDTSQIHLLENELKSNLTRLLQEALYKNYGSSVKPGSITYTVTATGVYNPQNNINQDLTDIRNQLEQQFLTELRNKAQTIRSETSSHSQSNRRYGSTGQTYYDSEEVEDLNRNPTRYTKNNMQRREHSIAYGSSHTLENQQPTERISYASALNSGRSSKTNFNTHTNVRYEPVHVQINPNVHLTDVMQNIQNKAHRQISEALRRYEEKYTSSSYRLTNSRPNFDGALNDFKDELRNNLTDQIQRELEKNYGVQTKLQGYSFSLNAGNMANYKLEDFDNLKKTMENNLNSYLENTLRQQESRYQQQVTTTNIRNRDYTSHGPQFTKSLTNSGQLYQPNSQSQNSYSSNYQSSSQTYTNPQLEEITRRLQSDLSRQLQKAVEEQRRMHTSSYQTQNSQALYQELENELRQNITRQMQESLNTNYGNQGKRGGYSYTITSGVYNPNANYQTQDLDTMMKQMQVELERQLREQMSSSSYKQGNYLVVKSGPYVVPNSGDSGMYTSSSYPMTMQPSTKSLNKYQQFRSYSHSSSDMAGEDCSQNENHNHQRYRRHTGGYYQAPVHFHHPKYINDRDHYPSHTDQLSRGYYSGQPRNYHAYPAHVGYVTHESEELGQQPEDLDYFGLQEKNLKPPQRHSQHTQNYRSHNHQSHQQPMQSSPEYEELGQQPEDLDLLGQEPENLDNLGQQPEDFSELSQVPQSEDDYLDLTPDQTPNEYIRSEIVVKPQNAPKPPTSGSLTKPDNEFVELGQQLEKDSLQQQLFGEVGQVPEDLDDYRNLEVGTHHQNIDEGFGKLQAGNGKPKPESSRNPKQTPTTTMLVTNSGQGGARQPGSINRTPPKQDELGQQIEDIDHLVDDDNIYGHLGQQLEDLDGLAQHPESHHGNLETGQEIDNYWGHLTQQSQDNFDKLEPGNHPAYISRQSTPKPMDTRGDIPQNFEDLEHIEDIVGTASKPSNTPYRGLNLARPSTTTKPVSETAHTDDLGYDANKFSYTPYRGLNLPRPSTTPKSTIATARNEGIGFDAYKPLNTPYRGLNLPRPTTTVKPVTATASNSHISYDDFQQTEDIFSNSANERGTYVPYRGLGLPRPTTTKPTNFNNQGYQYRPSYVPFSGLNQVVTPTTPKPMTPAHLYNPDDDTQQITQDIFGNTKPHSNSDDFLDHGDYLQYVGDRKDITHMESMDHFTQQEEKPFASAPLVHMTQQQEDVYKPQRGAISLSEANNMYVSRNHDANSPRYIQFDRNEQTSQHRHQSSYSGSHRREEVSHNTEDLEDLTQQSEDMGQQLEDLTQQSENFDDLTQQTQDLTQKQEDVYKPHRGAISLTEANNMYISRNQDANSPRYFQFVRNEQTSQQSFNSASHRREDVSHHTEDLEDLTQQSEDMGHQLEDLTQQSQNFDDLTQQSQDLAQQFDDLTQQTEDFHMEQQHAKVNYEPVRPLYTPTVSNPPRIELHPGYGRGLGGQEISSNHNTASSYASSYGRSLDKSGKTTEGFVNVESTTEVVEDQAPSEPTGFWKSIGGKLTNSFTSAKQKAKELMG